MNLFTSHSRHNNSAGCHPTKHDETATSSGRKGRIEDVEPPNLTAQLHEHQATIVQPSAGNGGGEVQKKSHHHHRHHHHHRNHKRHPQVVDVVRESIESESAEISEHFGQSEPPVLLFPPWSSGGGGNGRHDDLLAGDRGDHESVLTSVLEHGLKAMKLGSTSCCQQIIQASTEGEIPSSKQVAVVGDGKGKSARVECHY